MKQNKEYSYRNSIRTVINMALGSGGVAILIILLSTSPHSNLFLNSKPNSIASSVEIETQLLAIVSSSIDSLEGISNFAFLTLLATLISAAQRKKKIKILNFEISIQFAGIASLAILCGLLFQVLRLLQNLTYVLSQIVISSEQAKLILRINSWALNPFSETHGLISIVTDNLGYGLLLLVWWLGFHTSVFLLKNADEAWKGLGA